MSPQQRLTNEACNVTLMEKTNCDGDRLKCAFTVEEAKYICGLDKEVRFPILLLKFLPILDLSLYNKNVSLSQLSSILRAYIFISDGTMSWIHASMAFQFKNKNVPTVYLHR